MKGVAFDAPKNTGFQKDGRSLRFAAKIVTIFNRNFNLSENVVTHVGGLSKRIPGELYISPLFCIAG